MKVTYDPEVDAAIIHIQKGKYEISEPVDEDIIIDFDKEGRILSIEILHARERLPAELLETSQRQKPVKA